MSPSQPKRQRKPKPQKKAEPKPEPEGLSLQTRFAVLRQAILDLDVDDKKKQGAVGHLSLAESLLRPEKPVETTTRAKSPTPASETDAGVVAVQERINKLRRKYRNLPEETPA